MGLKGSHTNELVFRNCRVPKDSVIGGTSMTAAGLISRLDMAELSLAPVHCEVWAGFIFVNLADEPEHAVQDLAMRAGRRLQPGGRHVAAGQTADSVVLPSF